MTLPVWAALSLATNAILSVTVSLLLFRNYDWQGAMEAEAAATSDLSVSPVKAVGERQKLSYEEWVEVLGQEAQAMAETDPERLTILAGDSISLWFPPELLPPGTTWLNQGISGEVSDGLYRRLKLWDDLDPDAVFVMIGINDLLRGTDDGTILDNYWRIVRDIREHHPEAKVVIQSILPHGGEEATWEGRDRLLEIPNDRIQDLNRELKSLADAEGAKYLDLFSLFADENGKLHPELTTDGLHLNERGYWVWRSALQVYDRLEL
ncbi:MAG TPA: GDSL family lipase [Oscillatoriales cyanobacterium M59_W2019_021]|nr:GDSL family lipase [Oscillatoriales cyanobacterium M4454_W2019_049]HIK51363.1 GDSL family lipase [Oscillatoriales cyanobacterium M59_W2019_021]